MIPSDHDCTTALRRIEAREMGPDLSGPVHNPYVCAAAYLAEARVYLSRIAAYEDVGEPVPPAFRAEAERALVSAIRLLYAKTPAKIMLQ